MSKSLLVTRPNHDIITNYLYEWAGIEFADGEDAFAEIKLFLTSEVKKN